MYINSTNRLCYNEIIRVINVLLGSSLPNMGEVVAMTKYEKISLIIALTSLAIQIIDVLK